MCLPIPISEHCTSVPQSDSLLDLHFRVHSFTAQKCQISQLARNNDISSWLRAPVDTLSEPSAHPRHLTPSFPHAHLAAVLYVEANMHVVGLGAVCSGVYVQPCQCLLLAAGFVPWSSVRRSIDSLKLQWALWGRGLLYFPFDHNRKSAAKIELEIKPHSRIHVVG